MSVLRHDPSKRSLQLGLFFFFMLLLAGGVSLNLAFARDFLEGRTGQLAEIGIYLAGFALASYVYLASRPRDKRALRGVAIIAAIGLAWIVAIIGLPAYVISIVAPALVIALLIWLFVRRNKIR
jgi:NhaP-type Na+/H+ and K+/H+ antiporter